MSERIYPVVRGGNAVGFITKFPNTPTETHPYKAFVGIGYCASLLGCFYPADGGKKAAEDAILNSGK